MSKRAQEELADNHKRTKEWLSLALKNVSRAIGNYKTRDYPFCVFMTQLSIEQLQKSLIFFLGLQFRKTHEPSKILESIDNTNLQIEKENFLRIKKIARIAKVIELEGTATRYGEVIDDKLQFPEDKYDKEIAKKFLKDLYEILEDLYQLYKDISDLSQELKIIWKTLAKLKRIVKK